MRSIQFLKPDSTKKWTRCIFLFTLDPLIYIDYFRIRNKETDEQIEFLRLWRPLFRDLNFFQQDSFRLGVGTVQWHYREPIFAVTHTGFLWKTKSRLQNVTWFCFLLKTGTEVRNRRGCGILGLSGSRIFGEWRGLDQCWQILVNFYKSC